MAGAVAAGLGLGFITAAQVGPIWLLCLRSTLRGGFRVGLGGETADEVASPRRAFVTSLGATASNPMTIAAWAAIFSAASTASVVGSSRAAALVLLGAVCAGSFVWFVLLSAGTGGGRPPLRPPPLPRVDAPSAPAV